MNTLKVINLAVNVNGKKILNDISLEIPKGKVTVLMGPNGAGKSTISNVLMGNPKYVVDSGNIILDGEDITNLSVDERAKRGLFMSFQHPVEIDGITLSNFLRTSYNSIKGKDLKLGDFQKLIKEKMKQLEMDPKFKSRSLNLGYSGGEKKKSEILQLLLFEPKYAILDEIDSGLDVDSLKKVSSKLKEIINETGMGVLVITHYNKILEYIGADKVYVLKNGSIAKEGDGSIIKQIENEGFGD